MNKVSVLPQLYINQGKSIIGKQSEKKVQQPTYCVSSISSLIIGLLIGGIALAAVVTLYLKQQQSYTTVSTIKIISTTIIMTTNTTTQTTQMNQTSSSVAATQAYYCTGVSSYTLWQLFYTIGITMNINTSSCNYNSTPLYFTSIASSNYHWNLGGYDAIYVPTKNSFTVYALSLVGWNSTYMLSLSQTYQWNVDWYGISN